MTQANENVPGGNVPEAGGDGQGESQQGKFVTREAYERSVDKEKALKKQLSELSARVNEFETRNRAAEEAKLLEQNQHVQLIENLKKENETLKSQTQAFQDQFVESRKLTAAMGLLAQKGVQLDPKYIGLLPTDQIQVDPDGRPDMASVTKAIENFTKEHPRLVNPLPNDLPGTRTGGGPVQISYDQWTKLPYEEKLKQQKNVKMP